MYGPDWTAAGQTVIAMIAYSLTGKRTASFLVLCAAAAIFAGEASSADKLVYRYVMPDGKIIVTDSPLPEHAVYGYEVIDPDSDRVIRRVDPQTSTNEYRARQERRRALEDCQNELRNLRYRYASVRDIELARESNLAAIDHRATVIRSELRRAEFDLEDNLSRAARSERSGQAVTGQVSANIDRLREQIANLNPEFEQKVAERDAAVARYAREIERFVDGTCDHLNDGLN